MKNHTRAFALLPVSAVVLICAAGYQTKPAVVDQGAATGSAIGDAVDQQKAATNGAAQPGAITKADLNPAMSDSQKAILASHKNR